MKIRKFEDIEAWKEARKLVNMTYALTSKALFKKDFALRGQIQSAAVSCMSNIAEGFDSDTNQQFIQYLIYARRSSSEVQSEAYVALDIGYINQDEFIKIYEQAGKVGKLTNGFISYLKTSNNRPTGKQANRLTKKGFTLVEVFLVAALMGVVLISIFSAYNSGIRIWRSVKTSGLLDEKRFFISFEKLKKELMGYVRDFEDIDFEGDKDKLTFPALSGLEIVEITYRLDKKYKGLIKEEVKFSDSLKDKMNPEKTGLFEADSISFKYLFYDEEKETAEWITDFSAKDDGIPQAVKLEIRKGDEEITRVVVLP